MGQTGQADLVVTQIVAELREEAHERSQEDSAAGIFADHETAKQLTEWAGRLEVSYASSFEGIYESCADAIKPLVAAGKLPSSLVESVEALVTFRNSHDQLVEVAKRALEIMSKQAWSKGVTTDGPDAAPIFSDLRAALAAAGA